MYIKTTIGRRNAVTMYYESSAKKSEGCGAQTWNKRSKIYSIANSNQQNLAEHRSLAGVKRRRDVWAALW